MSFLATLANAPLHRRLEKQYKLKKGTLKPHVTRLRDSGEDDASIQNLADAAQVIAIQKSASFLVIFSLYVSNTTKMPYVPK